MIPHVFLLLILTSLISLSAAARTETTDSLMDVLESVLADREQYVRQRELNISNLRKQLLETTDDEKRYDIIGDLHDIYRPFNTDSAYYYSLQREEVAVRLDDREKILNARMNRASTLQAVAMYKEVADLMKDIDPEELPDYLWPHYYYIMRTLYGNLTEFSAFSPIRAQYLAQTRAYRDSVIKVNEPGSLAHAVSVADQYNSYGNYDKAVEVMGQYISSHSLSEHDLAICAWTLADSYRHLNNLPALKKQLIISSIGDIKAAVREYVSLRELALLLYKEGDLERAYRFMSIAIDDANKSNARQRLVELSAHYPVITGIYVEKIQAQRRALQKALWIIGILALGLVSALIYVAKQIKVISRSRKQLAEANDSLNTLNSRLQVSNDRLSQANTRLNDANTQLNEANTRLNDANAELQQMNGKLKTANAELQAAYKEIADHSRLKEAYIGKYMDECVAQIDSMDSYRKSLLKLLTAGKKADLQTRLKATDQLEDRLKNFYDSFDSTFLNLFPDFVEDFNSLLLPEEAIVPKRKGSLNTELRIFALIRLGITDSDKIARFLRYSVTTIYNYRTKVRNKAKGDRTALEDAVRSL